MDAASNGVQDRMPPHNLEAERSVLGSMLRLNGVIGDVVQIIRPENFYRDAHQKIFRSILDLYEKGMPADLVTLGEQLHLQKHIEDIGGYQYLAELWDAAPTAANAEHYARIVRDRAIVRSLIHASTEVLRDAQNQNAPADELLEGAERKIFEIAEWGVVGQTYDLNRALDEAFDRIDTRHERGHESMSGLPTGYTDLDNLTAGLQNSEFIVIAARPSVGKTALALNLARHIALDQGHPIFFVSLEQSRIELAERLLCAQARVDSHKLRKGYLGSDEMKKLIRAGDDLRQAKVFIDDSPGQTMLRITANARRLKLRQKIRLVIIDYLQLVEPDDRREARHEQVGGISRRMKFLAKELQIPVLSLAQLNRGVEHRTEDKGPRLADLRESGSIEQDADTVVLLHRPKDAEGNEMEGTVQAIIAKQRNGPTGEVNLTYLKQFMRFDNQGVASPFDEPLAIEDR